MNGQQDQRRTYMVGQAEIAARPETSGFEHRLDIGVWDMLDVGLSSI